MISLAGKWYTERRMMRRRRNKYGNRKITIVFKGKEVQFDSMKEASRAKELELLEKAGVINDLQIQVPFVLQPAFYHNGKRIQAIKYVADFAYFENGEYIVEDSKGVKTREYINKKKQMLYVHHIEIKET